MTDHTAQHLLRRTALAAALLLAAAPAALADSPAYLFLDFDHQRPAASAQQQRTAANQGENAASPYRPDGAPGSAARMTGSNRAAPSSYGPSHRGASTAPAP